MYNVYNDELKLTRYRFHPMMMIAIALVQLEFVFWV